MSVIKEEENKAYKRIGFLVSKLTIAFSEGKCKRCFIEHNFKNYKLDVELRR